MRFHFSVFMNVFDPEREPHALAPLFPLRGGSGERGPAAAAPAEAPRFPSRDAEWRVPGPRAPRRAARSFRGQRVPCRFSSAFQVEGSALGSASRGTGEAGRGAETREKWGEEGKATPEPSRRTCPPAPAAKVERAPALKKGAKCK